VEPPVIATGSAEVGRKRSVRFVDRPAHARCAAYRRRIAAATGVEEMVKPGRTAHEVAVEATKAIEGVANDVYSLGMFGYAMGISISPN
jgi:hypothetical protein